MRKPLRDWLGSRIREAREQVGFRNQSDFAIAMDTNQATVSRWENGKNEPEPETLKRIAKLTKKDMKFFNPLEPDEKMDQTLAAMKETIRTIELSRGSKWLDILEALDHADKTTIDSVRMTLGLEPISEPPQKAVKRKL